jgi:hypothetical protein
VMFFCALLLVFDAKMCAILGCDVAIWDHIMGMML